MNSYQDNLWFLLDKCIHDTEIKCQEYDVQLFFVKEKFFKKSLENSLKILWTTYYSQFITLESQGVDFSFKH